MIKEFDIAEWRRDEERKLTSDRMKKRGKLKNEALAASVFMAFIIFIISACMIDSGGWIPAVICGASVIYLFIFLKVNGVLEKILFPKW